MAKPQSRDIDCARRYILRRATISRKDAVSEYGDAGAKAFAALLRAGRLTRSERGRYRVQSVPASPTPGKRRFGDGGVFEEGRAASLLGVERERNPYRTALNDPTVTGDSLRGRLVELSNAWDSGWLDVAPFLRGLLLSPVRAVARANSTPPLDCM
jgi:hypothetical protein